MGPEHGEAALSLRRRVAVAREGERAQCFLCPSSVTPKAVPQSDGSVTIKTKKPDRARFFCCGPQDVLRARGYKFSAGSVDRGEVVRYRRDSRPIRADRGRGATFGVVPSTHTGDPREVIVTVDLVKPGKVASMTEVPAY